MTSGEPGAPADAVAAADDAFARGDLDGGIAQLSAAIRRFDAGADPCGAARACLRLGDVYAYALGNRTAAKAWFARARRLLEGQPPCVEQGWAAIAPMGCDVDDPDDLLAATKLALERARRFGDVNLETKALADMGLARVQAGDVDGGMELLDEAMALACGPADDSDAAGKSVCSFFTACYYAADFERAGSWEVSLRRHGLIGRPETQALGGHCDSVQATLLVELGRWAAAESLLTRVGSSDELMSTWHPAIALADLRTRQGRFQEAEVLLLGKDDTMQALLPFARLHLARGDSALARACAQRGLRNVGADRLRAVELLTVLVEAEIAAGAFEAAATACDMLAERCRDVGVVPLRTRAALAQAHLLGATGRPGEAVAVLEDALSGLAGRDLPSLRGSVLLASARWREEAGDAAGATLDAREAAACLHGLDVVVPPGDMDRLGRLTAAATGSGARTTRTAVLARSGKRWTATDRGHSVAVPATKGLRYLVELVGRPGVERHALDLVDAVEGVASNGTDRRRLGDAGPVSDAAARQAYRRRVEELRSDIDEALASGRIETAESLHCELETVVGHLAAAFGVGGRERVVGAASERARLNVTRAVRTAAARLAEALPDAGAALDRRLRTGLYCAYDPEPGDDVRWIVQS